AFTGDAQVDSGRTTTPFSNIPLSTGAQGGGGLQANGGSQLILQAAGNLDVVAPNREEVVGLNEGPPPPPPQPFFQFPGGAVFKAGGTLTFFVPVYNAWTTVAVPFQGIFAEAPVINALS